MLLLSYTLPLPCVRRGQIKYIKLLTWAWNSLTIIFSKFSCRLFLSHYCNLKYNSKYHLQVGIFYLWLGIYGRIVLTFILNLHFLWIFYFYNIIDWLLPKIFLKRYWSIWKLEGSCFKYFQTKLEFTNLCTQPERISFRKSILEK